MTPKQRAQVKKKFQELLDKACDESFKKYLVSKTHEGYKYYTFSLRKNPLGFFDCYQNEELVFESVCSFDLAVALCYNHLFEKSPNLLEKITNINDQAGKHKMDLCFYRNKLSNCDYSEYCRLQARINESKLAYVKAKQQIRYLTKGL